MQNITLLRFYSLFITLYSSLFTFFHLYAAGTTSCSFLKISIGAKNIAMGETGVISSDINSIYWNPAGSGLIQTPEISFMHKIHFQDIYYNYFGFAYPTKSGTFATGIYYLTVDEFQGYDEYGNKTKEINSYDFNSTLNYSKTFFGNYLSIGAGLKYIQEKLSTKHTNTTSFDFGTIYSPPIEYGHLRAGLSICNIFGKIKFSEESFSIPEIFRFGIGYIPPTNKDYKFSITTEFSIFEKEDTNFSIGLECIIKNIFSLRIGYITKYTSGLRAGIGVKFSNLMFDYAYSPYGELGNSHVFSITFKLGKTYHDKTKLIEKIYQNGLNLYNEKRYPEAIFEFNKILEIDPLNSDALQMLRKCNENLKD